MKKFTFINKRLWSGVTAIALVIALTVTALAVWPSFQNDNTNNGVISPGVNPPIASGTTPTTVALPYTGTLFDGVDAPPVVDQNGYAYTLYNGGNLGACLAITNIASPVSPAPYVVIDSQAVNGFELSTPYFDTATHALYVATTWNDSTYTTYGWNFWRVSGLPSTTPKIELLDSGDGQVNTPISGYMDANGNLQYVYFGTYTSSNTGTYRQYYVAGTPTPPITPTVFAPKDDFYYAGATMLSIDGKGPFVVFGGDNGLIYVNPVGASFATPTNILTLNTVQGVSPGHVRSSIMQNLEYYDNYVFFTSQGGSNTTGILWQVAFPDLLGSSTSNGVPLRGKGASTSTPVLSYYGVIYVGTYNSFTSGTVEVYSESQYPTSPPSYLATVYSGDPVQSSIIVWSDEYNLKDYVYFTTNADHSPSANHNGYCYSYDIPSRAATQIWNPNNPSSTPGSYALQGFAYDSTTGHVIYGDDSDTLYIF
jgi:hypothetical protein